MNEYDESPLIGKPALLRARPGKEAEVALALGVEVTMFPVQADIAFVHRDGRANAFYNNALMQKVQIDNVPLLILPEEELSEEELFANEAAVGADIILTL